jgi:hypothetical protein
VERQPETGIPPPIVVMSFPERALKIAKAGRMSSLSNSKTTDCSLAAGSL